MTAAPTTDNQTFPWLRAIGVVAAFLALAMWWWSGEEIAPPNSDHGPATAERMGVDLASGGTTNLAPQVVSREVVGEMQAGSWPLVVEVVDANGDAVAAAAVELYANASDSGAVAGRTNSDGLCAVSVTSDRVWVRARHSRIGRSLLVAATEDEHAGQPMRLLLWRPIRVTGVVLSADARPWPDVHVSLEARHILYGSSSPHVWPREVVTDVAGRFSFEAAAGVPGFARLSKQGFESVQVEWTATEDTQIVLAVPGALRIEGMVVDASGSPVPASVGLENESDYAKQAKLPVPGERFSIEPARFGKHRVVAVADGDMYAEAFVELSLDRPRIYVELKLEKQEIPEPPAEGIRIDVGSESGLVTPAPSPDVPALSIQVFDADGEPAKNVLVMAASELGEVMNYNLGEWQAGHGTLSERQVSVRPKRLLFGTKDFRQHGWLDLPANGMPTQATVRLGWRGSVSIEARCRGRAARGVTLQMWTHHEAFASGRGKHHLKATEVPAGPALVLVRRGFELIGRKTIIVQPGVLTTDVIEVELK